MTTSTPWRPPLLTVPRTVFMGCRQAEVLDGICAGLSNAQIGESLFLSEEAVKTRVKKLYRRLDARDRAHAAALACTGQVRIVVTGDYPQRRAA